MHGYINDMIWNNKIQEVQEPLQCECQLKQMLFSNEACE